jgi:putative SOS response-associated peptidase YedK
VRVRLSYLTCMDDSQTQMPVFLVPNVYDEWLTPPLASDADKEHTLSLLDVVSDQIAATITTYEVDRKVNNSRTLDPLDPGLIEPLVR